MIFYDNLEAVKRAYLDKALSSESPKQIIKIGDYISARGANKFKWAEECPTEITAKVFNKDIKNGVVRGEAPIQIISGAPEGFLLGKINVYAFATPELKENNLKPVSITSGGMFKNWSTCIFPAKHNFAIDSEETTVNYYTSAIDNNLYTEAELPEQVDSNCLEKYKSDIREERNARISDTDDLVRLEDMTIKVTNEEQRRVLSEDERASLMYYRQALRDLPETEGFPFVSMPAIPETLSLYLTEKINQRNQMEVQYV